MKFLMPYFDSELSFATFRILDAACQVAFGPEEHTIIIITREGNYYQCAFDPIKGGECVKQQEYKLISQSEN